MLLQHAPPARIAEGEKGVTGTAQAWRAAMAESSGARGTKRRSWTACSPRRGRLGCQQHWYLSALLRPNPLLADSRPSREKLQQAVAVQGQLPERRKARGKSCLFFMTGAVEGGVDEGTHGSEFVRHADEGGERRQRFIRAVDEVGVGDAHRRDAAAREPGLGVANLLAVGLGDVRSGLGGLAEASEHAILAVENFLHLALHEEDAVMEILDFGF